MEKLGGLSEIAGLLQALGGFVAVALVAIILFRPGGVKKFFFGRSGQDNVDDLMKAHKKAKRSREEVEAILLANGVNPKEVIKDKKRDIL